ncbi:MAG TPA: hypothetical protein VFD53_03275 [Ilumatobacter sp.]|nr:hypothetical protein [Ilumatobacter sp.]
MDGADEAFGSWVAAVLITLLACAILAVVVPSVVTVWAARTKRTRLWLVFALALVGVVSAEVCLVTGYMVLKDETSSGWAVILFGALSITSFIGVVKQPTRTA